MSSTCSQRLSLRRYWSNCQHSHSGFPANSAAIPKPPYSLSSSCPIQPPASQRDALEGDPLDLPVIGLSLGSVPSLLPSLSLSPRPIPQPDSGSYPSCSLWDFAFSGISYEWRNKWVDLWMEGWTGGQLDGQMGGWTGRRMDGWVATWIDR